MTLPDAFSENISVLLKDEAEAFFRSFDTPVISSLRLNSLRMETPALKDIAKKGGITTGEGVAWCPDGFYYSDDIRPGRDVMHEAGFYYIQEASAMLPGTLPDVTGGKRILDMCAAPGGKSTLLAAGMGSEGLLVSNEIIPSRAKILSENIERMGISNAIVTNESPNALSKMFPLYFDCILVDAPCSGEGMMRKNEQALSMWSTENVHMCAQRQLDILDHADLCLKPGGQLVYSTCTFSYEENEGVILSFLEKHPDYKTLPIKMTGGMTGPRSMSKDIPDLNCARILPHLSKGEGHFACILQKDGILIRESRKPAVNKRGMARDRDLNRSVDLLKDFLKENFTGIERPGAESLGIKPRKTAAELRKFALDEKPSEIQSRFLLFGKQLYLLPEDAPDIGRLKTVRPGLHLGTVEKDRFEPSMALARALTVYDINYYVNFDASSPASTDLLKYFEGSTFAHEGSKGWYLICLEGLGIGWGKLSGGIMKNHYPKGLRKNLKIG